MKNKLHLLGLAILISSTLFGQINIDLSTNALIKTETIKTDLEPLLSIKNMLPGTIHEYFIEIEEIQEEIPSLTIPNGAAASDCVDDDVNANFVEKNSELLSETDERNVPGLIKELKTEISKLDKNYSVCILIGNSTIERCEMEHSLKFKFKNNQTIKVKITRFTNDSLKKTWEYTFKTPTKTPWKVMYGFTFVPNILNPINKYYSQADTSQTFFSIEKQNNQRNDFFKNISPTIMFQWAPMEKHTFNKGQNWKAFWSNNFYQIGFTSGLSLNFSSENSLADINVMAGPSIIIADNISISGGIVLTPKSVLRGQYQESQKITEFLDFDQLHDKKYMAEWFISLAIRFDGNPFEKKVAEQ